MVKNIFLAIILLLPLFCKAQISVGDWKIHPVFGTDVTNIIDTDKKVYYLVDKFLYSYDKESSENESFTKRNKLSDIEIKDIYYNYDKKYLLIVYSNSNIDFLYDDGKIINLPDIKDVILTMSKNINDVTFNNNKVYMAADFGYVILNDEKHEVMESQIYNIPLYSIVAIGDNLFVSKNDGLFVSELNAMHTSIDSFTQTNIKSKVNKILPIDDKSFFFYTGWLYKATVNDNKTLSATTVIGADSRISQPTKTGFIAQATTPGYYILMDKDGNELKKVNLPESLQKSYISSYETNGSLWIMDSKGIKNVSIDNDNGKITEKILSDYFKPNSSTVSKPYNIVYNGRLKKLYVMNTGSNHFVTEIGNVARINTLDGSFWSDITPESASTIGTLKNGLLNDPFQPVFDPEDPNTYYVGSWYEGFYKVKDNKVVAKYDWTNSPMELALNWYCQIACLQFDKFKNLWVIQSDNSKPVMVLPRSKQSQEKVSASDWYRPNVTGFTPNKKMHFLITKRNNLKFITDGSYGSVFIAFDDNGTPDVNGDDKIKSYSSFVDQDEKTFSWHYIHCFIEDNNGKVWLGTDNGVVEISNPANTLNNNFRINRLKVPRNDGTQYADYLLENIEITCMAVDGANRKWIGTSTSGVFLVNETGSEILQHFTKSNSYLTDDNIISLACNLDNNSVYVGTNNGLAEYSSDASPAEENYSNVYAYPNPVRPDYTGWITIRGLMDNSLVKIADSAGNVFYSARSTGGMVTWDGCNSSGERVKTGIYYVFASQNEDGKSKGAVTKIMIVN